MKRISLNLGAKSFFRISFRWPKSVRWTKAGVMRRPVSCQRRCRSLLGTEKSQPQCCLVLGVAEYSDSRPRSPTYVDKSLKGKTRGNFCGVQNLLDNFFIQCENEFRVFLSPLESCKAAVYSSVRQQRSPRPHGISWYQNWFFLSTMFLAYLRSADMCYTYICISPIQLNPIPDQISLLQV